MSQSIVNRVTGETLTVELELGEDVWVRNERGDIEQALRSHFPLERWHFVGTLESVDDVPVPRVPTCNLHHAPTQSPNP